MKRIMIRESPRCPVSIHPIKPMKKDTMKKERIFLLLNWDIDIKEINEKNNMIDANTDVLLEKPTTGPFIK